MGGGRRHWLPKVAHDPEQTKEEGRRLDGRNLIDDWLRDKKKRSLKAEYVWNKGQLDKINPNEVDYLLGKFSELYFSLFLSFASFFLVLLRIYYAISLSETILDNGVFIQNFAMSFEC